MTPLAALASLTALCIVASPTAVAQQPPSAPPPPWAYGFTAPAAAPTGPGAAPAGQPQRGRGGGGGGGAPDTTLRRVPGSDASFTLAQVRDQYGPADWFPGDHPQMPPIVAQGRRDASIIACALCHYPNGKGRPDKAGVSGLPYAYFVQAMLDFKNDARKSADARKTNTNRMIAFAKAMTDEEIKAAAIYFSSMKWTSWVKVVETDSVPKTRIAAGMFIPLEGAEAGTEPIGQRIIEVPENTEATETLRNPRSGFTAYVPKGSINKGESLATTGQCALCHGATLAGLGPIPGIAGRSPSYVVRQLYDMQRGVRTGLWSELMKKAVSNLSAEDMLALAAYAASR
jgi:cytochrome c553